MSFKRPYVPHVWGRQRDQEEVERDARLEQLARAAAQAAPAGPGKIEGVRAQYRAASRAGLSKADIQRRYTNADVAIMDQHVDQMFWQMVRHELRVNAQFANEMQDIQRLYNQPQHEFLERIKNRFWAKMQEWTDDRNHVQFLKEIYRAWHAGMLRATPNPALQRALEEEADRIRRTTRDNDTTQGRVRHNGSLFGTSLPRGRESGVRPALWHALFEEDENALIPEFWEAFDAQQ